MRKCEEESSDGELSFIRSFHFFVAVFVAMFKMMSDPRHGRDYELLIGFFVDRFDGFYLYLFLQAKFSRCEGRVVEFRRSEGEC